MVITVRNDHRRLADDDAQQVELVVPAERFGRRGEQIGDCRGVPDNSEPDRPGTQANDWAVAITELLENGLWLREQPPQIPDLGGCLGRGSGRGAVPVTAIAMSERLRWST